MSDGKTYITTSDTRNGSGGGVSPDTPSETSEQSQDKESALSKYGPFGRAYHDEYGLLAGACRGSGRFARECQGQSGVQPGQRYL